MVRGKRAAAQQSGKQPAAKRGRPAKARALADPGPGPATMEDNDSAGPSRAPSPILPVIRQGRRATRTTGNQRQQELPGGSGHGAGWQQRPTEASIPSAADEDTDFSDEAEEIQGSEDDRATHQPWSNSTALPVRRQRNVSEQSFIDPADRLSAAIERTLAAVREASLAGEGSSRLVNRLTTAKALPSFSGDPLEWLHFKEAYISSSESGGYSDRENIARLFDALKGEARDVVKTLLASSRDADTIIKTLELHFGNKRAAAEKIVAELKTLPEIDSGRISLVQFATKLRSAVVAFKTFRLLGYLHSPELVKSVGHKIPIALRYAYNRYAVSVREEKSELEKLADFIYAEAELATEAGIFDIDCTTERPTQRVDRGAFGGSRRPSAKTAVVCVAERRDRRVETNATETRKCAFCKKDNHPSPKCLFFAREPVSKRWDLVKKYNLCFGCLRPGHSRNDCKREALTSLDDLVKGYFALEYTGIKDSVACKGEQDRALRILEETSSRKGKIWETGLLWKDDHAPSTNGLSTARKRLELLERRLDRDPEYARLYYQEMQRFLDQGYAQRVENTLERARTWYLPHFGVRNVNKPNKVRLVFDAAAKTGGISLNDQLMSGPDLLKSLPGILIRFRQYAVAVKADISDMFLRVQIRESDRGAQRFLWRGKDRNREPDIYEMSTLIFGAKSSPCSAIYVKDKNAKDCNEAHPEAVRSIINDSYMDDFLSSRRTVREAAELVRDVIAINARANFAMHGWASNKAEALRNSVDHGQRLEQGDTRLGDRGGERVLGLFWDTQNDELKFNVELKNIPKEILLGEKKPTKREFLRVIMSVFDPLGILAPFTLKSKIIMQEIWRSGINWDDPLREEDFVRWRKWVSMIDRVKECRMPRCYGVTESRESEAQLHVFCDASLTAYAAVAYLRFENENESESAHVSLIMAKSRVAPLKPLTIPRLELQAALMGTRLATFVEKELDIKISRRVFWSDSTTVISWIRSEPRTRQVFVANRLGEIGENTRTTEWRWVPTGQNPADDATRFENSSEFISPRWFEGPEFLRRPESEWPIEKTLTAKEKATIDDLEQRKACVYVAATVKAEFSLPIRLMGWRGLLVIARRVHAIVGRWKGKNTVKEPLEIVQIGEQYWYRVIQEEYFGAEIVALRHGRNINKGSKIAGLNPYVDEQGILRANGRVTATGLEGFDNRPIILEGRHPATKLLIAEYHRKFYHASSDAVVNELRQKYHIIGLRRVLRSLISRCIVCRIRRGRPQNPLMSALPVGRVAFRQRPFTHCGVDYFGPLMVKIGRRREKRWGVLFTCLTTRAIHLEIAHSLSASSAIMASQRLAARRGTPQVVYSDNGTNFRGADKELKDATASMDRAKIKEYALSKRVKWVFNPPDAPHMGGAWERLIRSVKTALNVILREQAPSEEVLSTLFAEAEHSVNSRPLTHVSLDPRDKEALTPNHFLIGSSSGEVQLGRYDLQNVCLRKQWRTAQSFAEAFWKRWLREYLPTLVPRKKWTEKENPLEVGDIVLIVDLQAPRNSWRKGTVTRVFPGVDKEVRVAE
ncbi:uncharacterized protein LOC143265515, partial [Megachile rotundata]|uniref:uncharacterized protein LOC143265515 n=1 Tax=Megachile rotundata TaxID=143995 RepID=UPI003FD2D048